MRALIEANGKSCKFKYVNLHDFFVYRNTYHIKTGHDEAVNIGWRSITFFVAMRVFILPNLKNNIFMNHDCI